MFTGIVEELGSVKNIIYSSQSIQLAITCEYIMDDVKTGDSIAVNGICLTVTGYGRDWFCVDVMPETMRKTNLVSLKIASKVNLERAIRLSDRLGGHLVSGHIDGTGIISAVKDEDNAVWLSIKVDENILKYIVMKGSITLDGTSLTVAQIDNQSFMVSLIPLTRGVTTLGFKKSGDLVNVECDIIGKYVEKLIDYRKGRENNSEGLTLDFLKENGFV